jgi:hypothetical protein
MRPLGPTVALLLLLAPGLRAQELPDSAARRAVGSTAIVVGTVVEVKDRAHHGYAYLNFGAAYPKHTFSVWIPDSMLPRFGDLQRFTGKRVRATGLVWLQNNEWPAMTITDPKDLTAAP